MNQILTIFLTLLLFSCSSDTSKLEDKVQTIELQFIPWACDCANWATTSDIEKYHENIDDTLARLSIFVEPAYSSVILPDTVGYINDRIKFVGQFYREKGFPKDHKSDQPVEQSRVFRYTKYEILNSGFSQSRIEKSKAD